MKEPGSNLWQAVSNPTVLRVESHSPRRMSCLDRLLSRPTRFMYLQLISRGRHVGTVEDIVWWQTVCTGFDEVVQAVRSSDPMKFMRRSSRGGT